jgi:putative MATE family efflux protein
METGAGPPPSAQDLPFGALIASALRGEQHDYTRGSIDRAIALLAIPTVLEMIMESIFAVVDVYWVSRLGADAVAAVGLTESLLSLLYALAMGLAMAATAAVARRVGEKEPKAAARAAGQAVMLGVLVALPLTALGTPLSPMLLRAMGASSGAIDVGTHYAMVMMASSPSILLLFLINAALRGAGDAAAAMRVLVLANTLNIVLGPIFIFGLHMGVTGAAVATTLGRSIGVIYQLWLLFGGRGRLRLTLPDLRPEWAALTAMVRISLGGIGQSMISTVSWILQMRLVAPFGAAAVAGYTIGFRVIVFAILPAWGLANAAATLVGQNLGAKAPERASQSVSRAGWWNTAVLSLVGLIFYFASRPIIAAFTHDPAVVASAETTLRVVALGFPFYGFGMVYGAAFNGAGDTKTPTWLNFFCFWLFEIPLGWVLSTKTSMGLAGVCAAIALAFSISAVAGGVLFRRGRWQSVSV